MKRSAYWDSLKFILISLVIYTHIVSPFRAESQFNDAIYNFVYMFHMPLFVFVSGRFSYISNKKSFINRTIKLVETYIVFQLLFNALSILTGNDISISSFTKPFWIFWYLLSLTYWRLMVYFMPDKWLRYRKIIILLSLCVSLLGGYLPIGYHFAIHRTLSFLPFFVVGYYSVDFDLHKYLNRMPSYIAAGTMLAVFILIYHLMIKNYSFVLHCPYSEWEASAVFNGITDPVIRCIFISIAVVLSVMLLRITYVCKRFAEWGRLTLFIYVYHSIVLKLLFQFISRNYLPNNELLLVIYSFITIILLLYLSRFKVVYLLLNPISYYRELKMSRGHNQYK